MANSRMSLGDNIAKTILFGPKKRKRALRKLATYVEANVQIGDALRQMALFASANGQRKDFTAKVFKSWANRIGNGQKPSEAMTGYMPEMERQLIVAADESGRLGAGIREALEVRDGIDRIRKAMRSALLYPLILLMGVTGYFMYMSRSILPSFRDTLEASKWPASMTRLQNMSDFVSNNVVAIYVGAALVVAAFLYILPRWTGPIRAKCDRYIPFSIYRTVYGTIFLLSLSGYVKAGMNTPIILQTMLRTAQPWYAERLRAISKRVKAGRNVGDALEEIGFEFPDRQVIEDLRVFTRHKGFEVTLKTMGAEILEESIARLSAQSAIVRNLAILVLGMLIISFTNAIFDYQNAVSTAASSAR